MILRALYTLLHALLLPALILRLLWRSRRYPDLRHRLAERLGGGVPLDGRPRLWIHAVSVGEVSAAAPLVRRLAALHPDHAVLVTTTTPTGAAQARRLLGDIAEHRYLPFDLPFAVRRFLDGARPRLAVVVETELWPNLFAGCAAAGLPLVVVNARLSEASARGYRRIGGLMRETLSNVAHFCARSADDAKALQSLGAAPDRITVTGNIKFDLAPPDAASADGALWRTSLGADRAVWIAASTHAGEDEAVLAAHRQVLEVFPDALLLLAPRHPERADGVARQIAAAGFDVIRRSALPASPQTLLPHPTIGSADGPPLSRFAGEGHRSAFGRFLGRGTVVLVDTLGELPAFYAAADLAFVGGSLVPVGGHNLLEPAALGRPVLTGPYLHNFEDVAAILREADALVVVRDADGLASRVAGLFGDPAERAALGERARRAVEENNGALDRTAAVLETLLPPGG